MTCKECDTDTCHRTSINPYCSTAVYIRCEFCHKAKTVRGFHVCDEDIHDGAYELAEDPLGRECEGCNAERYEECRPGCLAKESE